jgi:hypothetical protein
MFKCIECGVEDVEDEDDICDDCAMDYDDTEEDEE